jgi:hypothetical protein
MVRRLVPLMALLSAIVPLPVLAQDAGGQLTRPVSLKMENSDIRMALKLLFDSAGLSFSIMPDVTGTVTTSLREAPFRTALETVLRSNTVPLTYRVEGGVYTVALKSSLDQPGGEHERIAPKYPVKIILNYASAQELAKRFSGVDKALLPAGIASVTVSATDNALIVRGSEEAIRGLKEIVRLFDIAPRHVELQAELLVAVKDKAGNIKGTVLNATGWANGPKPTWLKAVQETTARQPSKGLTSGRYSIRVEPRINADNTISVEYTGEIDILLKVSAPEAPLRINRSFSGSSRVVSGEAVELSSSTVKRDEDGNTIEVRLRLTPTIARDPHDSARAVKSPASGKLRR